MPSETGLSERLRAALAGEPSLRQVKMFGGVSFMVNGKLAAGVTREGDLLLRCDPVETDLLLARRGARVAEMGAGRRMSRGWIIVDSGEVASESDLHYWIGIALAFSRKRAGRSPRS